MAKLMIEIDDSLLSKALIESEEQQVSLDIFINEALRATLIEPNPPARRSISIETMLRNAVEGVKARVIGTEFNLFDICAIEDWEALSSGERKSLGKNFRKAVEGAESPIAKYIGRTSSNKAIYRRIEENR